MEAKPKERTLFTSSIVSYPERCTLWGDGRYRGNCDGRLFLNLVRRYNAKRVADPMVGSGTTRDVIAPRTSPYGFAHGPTCSTMRGAAMSSSETN
jgi:hypothetical protein